MRFNLQCRFYFVLFVIVSFIFFDKEE